MDEAGRRQRRSCVNGTASMMDAERIFVSLHPVERLPFILVQVQPFLQRTAIRLVLLTWDVQRGEGVGGAGEIGTSRMESTD